MPNKLDVNNNPSKYPINFMEFSTDSVKDVYQMTLMYKKETRHLEGAPGGLCW